MGNGKYNKEDRMIEEWAWGAGEGGQGACGGGGSVEVEGVYVVHLARARGYVWR